MLQLCTSWTSNIITTCKTTSLNLNDELNPLKRLRDQSYALELKGCPSLKVFISRFHEAIEQVTEMSDLYDITYFTWVLVSPTREDVQYNGIGVPWRSRWRIIDRIVAAGGITSTRILARSITCSFISSVSTTCILRARRRMMRNQWSLPQGLQKIVAPHHQLLRRRKVGTVRSPVTSSSSVTRWRKRRGTIIVLDMKNRLIFSALTSPRETCSLPSTESSGTKWNSLQ